MLQAFEENDGRKRAKRSYRAVNFLVQFQKIDKMALCSSGSYITIMAAMYLQLLWKMRRETNGLYYLSYYVKIMPLQ